MGWIHELVHSVALLNDYTYQLNHITVPRLLDWAEDRDYFRATLQLFRVTERTISDAIQFASAVVAHAIRMIRVVEAHQFLLVLRAGVGVITNDDQQYAVDSSLPIPEPISKDRFRIEETIQWRRENYSNALMVTDGYLRTHSVDQFLQEERRAREHQQLAAAGVLRPLIGRSHQRKSPHLLRSNHPLQLRASNRPLQPQGSVVRPKGSLSNSSSIEAGQRWARANIDSDPDTDVARVNNESMARTTTTGQYTAIDDNIMRTLDISYRAKSFYLSCFTSTVVLVVGRAVRVGDVVSMDGCFRSMDGSRYGESDGPTQAMVVGPLWPNPASLDGSSVYLYG
ncbi:unnamed protein product [Heligmosomoides polygyrus]|uniref:Helitron_like_N domain-containing protein n=1 Tax=Heligmosomoides polygyrus TaxID=6339 RepID=A0A183FU63_HELPZ|nr:unnamed protein product [Heligmosomoides polygyrus]